MRKKTHEEYIIELQEKNPDVEVIGTYINNSTPILHKCLIHNEYFESSPCNVLKGRRCSICGKEQYRQKRTKTHEQYVEEVKKNNPTIEVIGKYINAKTKITHHCLVHNIYWDALPDAILRGSGCSECTKDKIHDRFIKSHEQYVRDLYIKNPDIEVIGQYINSSTPITHHCLIHDIYWEISPNNALNGRMCPECSKDNKRLAFMKTHEQYVHDVKRINKDIEVIGRYVGARTPILHLCKRHNIKWMALPYNILMGRGCPECKKEKCIEARRKDNEQYIEELKIRNPDILPLEDYINSKTPILHRCLIDNNEWYISPNNALRGEGCPKCHESNGERIIRQWLENYNIKYIYQKTFDGCKDKQLLSFDFYLPDYSICIEYQGEQHYFPVEVFGGQEQFEKQIKHDKIKSDYCKQNNIRLLCISYDEDINEALTNFLFI